MEIILTHIFLGRGGFLSPSTKQSTSRENQFAVIVDFGNVPLEMQMVLVLPDENRMQVFFQSF